PPLDPTVLRGLPAGEQLDRVTAQLARSGAVPAGMATEVGRRFGVFAATIRAAWGWRPRPLDRPVTYFPAAASDPASAERLGSCARAGLDHRVVAGDHYRMLQPPHRASLADAVGRCLDAAGPN